MQQKLIQATGKIYINYNYDKNKLGQWPVTCLEPKFMKEKKKKWRRQLYKKQESTNSGVKRHKQQQLSFGQQNS